MRLGPYELVGLLGQGGSGAVYRARVPGVSTAEVAVKLLTRADALALGRFEREARLLATLDARGFVPILGSGTDPRGSWFAMPLMAGGTLRARLENGPLPVEDALTLARHLARTLAGAHERGVIHRDLKPENVLFDAAGAPHLADLGLAKHFRRDAPGASLSQTLTRGDQLAGTIGYMAREQMADVASAGPPADVFSLAAIIYECLEGRPAFSGHNPLDVLAKVEAGERPRLTRAEVPDHVAATIERGLAREPGERFEDAGAFLRALDGGASKKGPATWHGLAFVGVGLIALIAGALLAGAVLVGAVARERRPPPPAAIPVAPPAPDAARLVASIDHACAAHDLVRALNLAETGVAELPSSAAVRLALGLVHELRGDAAARLDAIRALEIDPDLLGARELLVREAASRNDPGALDLASALIASVPSSVVGWRFRARVRLALGRDLDAALVDAARAHELDPAGALDEFTRSYILDRLGRSAAAADALAEALRIDPSNASEWGRLAALRRGLGQIELALEALASAIDRDPRNGTPLRIRADIYRSRREWARADADLARATDLEPKNADAWCELATIRLDGMLAADALAPATKAVELRPDSRSFLVRGRARERRHDFVAAIADATRAIELDPESSGAYYVRAEARLQRAENAAAVADYDRSVTLAPSAWGYYQRGFARDLAGDHAGAVADIRKCIELGISSGYILSRLAEAQLAAGAIDDAIASATRGIEDDRSSAFAWAARGHARAAKGDLAGGHADLDAAIEREAFFLFIDQRGSVKAKEGDLRGAIADFDRAVERSRVENQENLQVGRAVAATIARRGLVREELGEREAARTDFEESLRLDPHSEAADLARAGLARVR